MSPKYEWQNRLTGEKALTDHYDTAPDDSGVWRRVFSVGIGKVPGAGGSPARTPTRKKT